MFFYFETSKSFETLQSINTDFFFLEKRGELKLTLVHFKSKEVL